MATFIRWSGAVAIIAGILAVYVSFQRRDADATTFPWYYRAGDIGALIALVGIYLYQREATGAFGLIAFIVASAAVLMLIFRFKYELAISIYALGLILLAISALRANSFPNWVPWMWIVAPLIGIPGFFMPNQQAILNRLAAIAFALGFIGAGYHLFTAG